MPVSVARRTLRLIKLDATRLFCSRPPLSRTPVYVWCRPVRPALLRSLSLLLPPIDFVRNTLSYRIPGTADQRTASCGTGLAVSISTVCRRPPGTVVRPSYETNRYTPSAPFKVRFIGDVDSPWQPHPWHGDEEAAPGSHDGWSCMPARCCCVPSWW